MFELPLSSLPALFFRKTSRGSTVKHKLEKFLSCEFLGAGFGQTLRKGVDYGYQYRNQSFFKYDCLRRLKYLGNRMCVFSCKVLKRIFLSVKSTDKFVVWKTYSDERPKVKPSQLRNEKWRQTHTLIYLFLYGIKDLHSFALCPKYLIVSLMIPPKCYIFDALICHNFQRVFSSNYCKMIVSKYLFNYVNALFHGILRIITLWTANLK